MKKFASLFLLVLSFTISYGQSITDIAFKTEGIIRKLDQTVNYVTVYSIIRDYMKKPEALLETLAENMTNTIYASDQRITKINITINKLNPPIANFSGQVGVSFEKSFIE